jgi:hypothetical protein
MAEALTLSYIGLGLLTIGLFYVIWLIVKRNQEIAAVENAPAVAGSDELTGGAKNPTQFDEPDDDALEQMADVLASAAEAQGLVLEEE